MTLTTTNVDRCNCHRLSDYPGEWPLCLSCDEPICHECRSQNLDRCQPCAEQAWDRARGHDSTNQLHVGELVAMADLRACAAADPLPAVQS